MAEVLAKRIAEGISRRSGLLSLMKPIANWYGNAAGYRQVGLR